MDRKRNPEGTHKKSLRKKLGTHVVEARKRRRWSQVELARRLGVSRGCLGKWERGVCAPGLEELALLSRVLEIPLWEARARRGTGGAPRLGGAAGAGPPAPGDEPAAAPLAGAVAEGRPRGPMTRSWEGNGFSGVMEAPDVYSPRRL